MGEPKIELRACNSDLVIYPNPQVGGVGPASVRLVGRSLNHQSDSSRYVQSEAHLGVVKIPAREFTYSSDAIRHGVRVQVQCSAGLNK